MHIRAYLEKYSLTLREFSRRCGMREASISRYISNSRVPTQEEAMKIVETSNGEITMQDLGYEPTTVYKKVKHHKLSKKSQKDGDGSGSGD